LTLTLPSLKDERDPFPPGIVDKQSRSSIGGADGVGRDGAVVKITRLAIRGYVLAKKCVFAFNWWDAA
jgi:hypothetical protein